MGELPQPIADHVASFGQGHVFQFWDELDETGRQTLVDQLRAIDFAQLRRLQSADHAAVDYEALAAAAEPPRAFRLAFVDGGCATLHPARPAQRDPRG